MMPAILLKKMVMGNFEKGLVQKDIADSVDFMVESVSLGWITTLMMLSDQSKTNRGPTCLAGRAFTLCERSDL